MPPLPSNGRGKTVQAMFEFVDIMKKSIIAAALALLSLSTAMADGKYPVVRDGGSYVCKGEENCRLDDKATFGSVVLWALENSGDAEAANMKCDSKRMTVSMNCSLSENDDADRTYTFHLNMGVKNGKLAFLVNDIKCTPKGVLSMFKTVTLDKLNLEKKPQNKEYVDKFAALCDAFMQKTLSSILSADVNLSHWDAIVEGKVVKGMNLNEVRLAKGNPLTVTENSQRTMWSYESGTVVMIENGVVSGVIN